MSDIFIYSTSIDLTQHNIKADPWGLLRAFSGSASSKFASALGILWVHSESAIGVLRAPSWGPLYTLVWDRLAFFLPPVSPSIVYSKYTCRDIWSFFSSHLRVCFWNQVCFLCSIWGLLEISSRSAIADPKQALNRHRK